MAIRRFDGAVFLPRHHHYRELLEHRADEPAFGTDARPVDGGGAVRAHERDRIADLLGVDQTADERRGAVLRDELALELRLETG